VTIRQEPFWCRRATEPDVLCLVGELDLANEHLLAPVLENAQRRVAGMVLVDVSAVEFLSLQVMFQLAELHRDLHSQGRGLVLRGAGAWLIRQFALLVSDAVPAGSATPTFEAPA
jgi:anti-anti-sigma regulatory factor